MVRGSSTWSGADSAAWCRVTGWVAWSWLILLLARLGRVGGLRPDERTLDESDAVRLEAAWGDFVANVSHELKTPVGAVALLAEAVLDAADEPREVRRFGTKDPQRG